MTRSSWCSAALVTCGIALIAVGLTSFLYLIPHYVKENINQELVIREGSRTADPNYFIMKQVWFFNITNPDRVVRKGERPILKEVGPFAYRTKMRNKNITYSEDGNTVRMKTDRIFYYNREHSCPICDQDLMLTVPNMMLFTMYDKIRNLPTFFQNIAATAFLRLRAQPLVTRKASELLFDGYHEILLKVMKEAYFRSLFENVPERIGYFSGINATNAGFFTFDTGKRNINDVGKILTWMNRSTVPEHFWETEQTRMINGSSGARYKPDLKKDDILYVFLSDICRSVYFKFEKAFKYQGLEALRYGIPLAAFDWNRPENRGFCNTKKTTVYFKDQPKDCLPRGLMDISRCKTAAPPSAASMPHMLGTPDYVLKEFPDLHPSFENHRSWVELEKNTGVPIRLSLKFQINIATFQDKNFRVLKNFNDTILPVLWLNQTATMDTETRDLLYNKLYKTVEIANIVCYCMVGFGGFLLIAVITFCLFFTISSSSSDSKNRTKGQTYLKPIKV